MSVLLWIVQYILLPLLGYVTVGVVGPGRYAYGRERARKIAMYRKGTKEVKELDGYDHHYPYGPSPRFTTRTVTYDNTAQEALELFRSNPGTVVGDAVFVGLLWPFWCVWMTGKGIGRSYRFVLTAAPRKTPADKEAAQAQLQANIERLEAENRRALQSGKGDK